MTELGQIEAIFRYPVKSMRGERLDTAPLGWHGLDGDRRLALRRLTDHGDFPWLIASKLPALLLYTPHGEHVRTPDGEDLPTFGEALAADVSRRHQATVEMMRLKHGMFDDASISVITTATAAHICRLAGVPDDIRRFRPNIVVRSTTGVPFDEDAWVGRVLTFGDTAIAVTQRDLRCSMVNYDPDDVASSPEVLKAVARANDTFAGVYATVTRIGELAVGQTVVLD